MRGMSRNRALISLAATLGIVAVAIMWGVLAQRQHEVADVASSTQGEPGSRVWAEAKALDEAARVTKLARSKLNVIAATRDGNSWDVLIDFGASQPGAHCSVLVRDDGTTEYSGGL